MSVRCIDRVLNGSRHSGTALLMLVVLADYSDDDGNSYPAVASLARKCRMSPRNANYILTDLQGSGELRVLKNQGPKGTNRYRLNLSALSAEPLKPTSPLKSASPPKPIAPTPEAHFLKPLKPIADEPSLNRQLEDARAPRSPADKGARLPVDWSLPSDWRSWAVEIRPDIDVRECAEAFADYWHAVPGAKGRKLDWLATWRNWVRNHRSQPGGTQRRPGPNPFEGAR